MLTSLGRGSVCSAISSMGVPESWSMQGEESTDQQKSQSDH